MFRVIPLRRHPGSSRAVLLTLCLGFAVPPAQADKPAPMQQVVSGSPPYVLMKPTNWSVRHDVTPTGLVIVVASPDARSVAEVEYSDNRAGRPNSASLLASRIAALAASHPELAVSDAQVCAGKDAPCAVATLAYTGEGGALQSRWFVHADAELATIRHITAPASRMAQDRTVLLDVLANLRLTPKRPATAALVERRAPDRSLSLMLPSDWRFIGQKGTVLASAPAGRAGFVFTVFSVLPDSHGVTPPPGVIIGPYRAPSGIVVEMFKLFRNRDVRVVAGTADPASSTECTLQIRRPCEAADVQLTWTSPEGVACAGSFKVLNARPDAFGQWFSILSGAWGPADDLGRHLPVLRAVADSFSIDDAFAKRTIEQGMAHLQDMQRQTRRAIEGLYQAIEQNQRDDEGRVARKEASDAKWDDYRRGNSYWISDIEGGKVYQTDPWGTRDLATGDRIDGPPYDYIHFEGRNPAHPSEHMREISSDDLRRMRR